MERMRNDPLRKRFLPDPGLARRETEHYDLPHLNVPKLSVDASNGYSPDFETILVYTHENLV